MGCIRGLKKKQPIWLLRLEDWFYCNHDDEGPLTLRKYLSQHKLQCFLDTTKFLCLNLIEQWWFHELNQRSGMSAARTPVGLCGRRACSLSQCVRYFIPYVTIATTLMFHNALPVNLPWTQTFFLCLSPCIYSTLLHVINSVSAVVCTSPFCLSLYSFCRIVRLQSCRIQVHHYCSTHIIIIIIIIRVLTLKGNKPTKALWALPIVITTNVYLIKRFIKIGVQSLGARIWIWMAILISKRGVAYDILVCNSN